MWGLLKGSSRLTKIKWFILLINNQSIIEVIKIFNPASWEKTKKSTRGIRIVSNRIKAGNAPSGSFTNDKIKYKLIATPTKITPVNAGAAQTVATNKPRHLFIETVFLQR